MGTQRFEQRLGLLESVAQEVARGVGAAAADAFENIGLRLLPKPLQAGDLAVFARLLKLLDRFEAEFVVQGLDLLWPQPGDVEHRHQPRWDRGFQVLVILQAAGGDEFGDLLLERIADAFDVAHALFGNHFIQRLAQGLNGAGGVLIRAGLERILSLQLQQRRDVDQHFGYVILVHE